MANAYTLVQALKAAGKNLTRQGLIKAIETSGRKWTGPGPGAVPLLDDRAGGYGGAEMAQIRGGKIILFGGPLTTDPTPAAPITAYSGKQPAPPASGVPSG